MGYRLEVCCKCQLVETTANLQCHTKENYVCHSKCTKRANYKKTDAVRLIIEEQFVKRCISSKTLLTPSPRAYLLKHHNIICKHNGIPIWTEFWTAIDEVVKSPMEEHTASRKLIDDMMY